MSRINGEKARAAIAKKNRTARRLKDRATLARLRAEAAAAPQGAAAAPKKAAPKKKAAKSEAAPAEE